MPLIFSCSATPTAARAAEQPTSLPLLSRCLLQLFEHSIAWCIFSVPPAPAVFDQHVIDLGTIGQEHVSKGALVLVEAVLLDRDFFPNARSATACLARLS